MFASTAQEAKRKDIKGTSRMKKYSIAHIIVNNSVNNDFRHDVLIEVMRCLLSIQNFCIYLFCQVTIKWVMLNCRTDDAQQISIAHIFVNSSVNIDVRHTNTESMTYLSISCGASKGADMKSGIRYEKKTCFICYFFLVFLMWRPVIHLGHKSSCLLRMWIVLFNPWTPKKYLLKLCILVYTR